MTASAADEYSFGDVGCADLYTLEVMVLEQMVPAAEEAERSGCAILPQEYVPHIVGTVQRTVADCGYTNQLTCVIDIVQAVDDSGRVFYIAIDWLDLLAADISEDLLLADAEPFVPIGMPCEYAECAGVPVASAIDTVEVN